MLLPTNARETRNLCNHGAPAERSVPCFIFTARGRNAWRELPDAPVPHLVARKMNGLAFMDAAPPTFLTPDGALISLFEPEFAW